MSLDIKTFSELVGVSTATVSRAFSGNGRISKQTQTRILEEARRLDFSPNIHAQRLNRKRTNMIGLYYTFSEEAIFDYYNMELAQEIAKAAEKHGYSVHLELGRQGKKDEDQRLRELTSGLGLDGVIVVSDGLASGSRLIRSIRRCPVAIISGQTWKPIGNEIVIELDVTSGIREATAALVRLGHTRIAYMSANGRTSKPSAFRFALGENGLTYDESLFVTANKTFASGQDAFESVIRHKPTAILCATDILALGALNQAHILKFRVPQDISIVGMDDLGFTAFTTPSLATVGIPRDQIASTAVGRLLARIESGDNAATHSASRYVISSYFLNRSSVSKAPHTKKP